MLSKQYTPRAGDMVENEDVPSLRRGSQAYGEAGMTLRDLQRLEEMVDDAEDDPEMRQRLRRSMSGKRLCKFRRLRLGAVARLTSSY